MARAAIFHFTGTLSITDSSFTNNTGSSVGAVYASGPVTMSGCVFTGNSDLNAGDRGAMLV